MPYFFNTLAGALSVYSFLCIVRIIMTWIPGANYSGFGRFLSSICDPFLNMFSGIRVLRVGPLDLSPLLALGILSMLTLMLQNLAEVGRLTLAYFLILFINMIWNIVSTLLLFLIIFVAIRLIVHLMGADRNSSLWYQIDGSLSPFVYSISKFFSAGKPVAYKIALIVAIITLIILWLIGDIAIHELMKLCERIPF